MHDAWRVLRFDEIAHNLVVEERNRSPLNAFASVLVLFVLQREFNENLLQFFIDVVDANCLFCVCIKITKQNNNNNKN